MFERLHGENEYGGTGIGLPICRRIVERHGGRIWCEPRAVGGTAFHFTLPG
jgi:signal transduction histidine kinase